MADPYCNAIIQALAKARCVVQPFRFSITHHLNILSIYIYFQAYRLQSRSFSLKVIITRWPSRAGHLTWLEARQWGAPQLRASGSKRIPNTGFSACRQGAGISGYVEGPVQGPAVRDTATPCCSQPTPCRPSSVRRPITVIWLNLAKFKCEP